MKIAFNPSTVAALTSPPDNKDITFDLRGQNIFARGVKFYGTDTNTWRDIKVNNVSIGSHTLDLRNGSNTTLTNTNGVVTINSTWRPVVDNLTSNSATSSLSANQGRVLAGLINGKSDSDHNHDDRYLKLTGGTLTGNLIGTSAIFSGRVYGSRDDEGIIIKPAANGYAGLILGTHSGERSIFYFVKNRPFWRYSHGSDNLDITHPKKSGIIALTSDIPSSVKNPYSLTTFGVVYDGSAEKVVSPSNFISQLEEDASVVTDGTMFVTSWASDKGFADTNAVNVPYKRKAARLWDYIKTKTDTLYPALGHNHDNKYLRWFGNAGQTNMNAIGRFSHSSGMTNLRDPGNTTDNPMEGNIKSTSWHLYWQTNFAENPGGSNAWVAQIVNRAGTDRWWIRSRSGGTITNGTGWTSNWRFLVTAPTSGLGNGNQPVYINSAGEVVAANSYPTSLKSPHSLTLKANGTTLAIYDGSFAKEANFTYANVGAASAYHTHSYYAVNEYHGGFKKAERLPTSGFYQSEESESGGNAPWKGWMHLINCQHSNTNNNYALQIAAGFYDDNTFKIRVTNDSVNNAWRDIIHSGNISSQSVAYASSAGNSETLGGFPKNYSQAPFGTIPCIRYDGVMEIGKYIDFHNDNSGKYDYSTRLQTTGNYANVVNLPSASGTLALISQVLTGKPQIIDMRSYSESYWHPVTVPLPNTGYNKIKVSVQLNSGDKPSWATHKDGITCNMEIWATASGWGTTDSDTICLNYTYKFCSQNPCGWMQLGNPSLGVVFLRGGSRYTVYTDFDATFTPHNQKYTWSGNGFSQDTGGPYTSCPGLNFNMGAIRADLIATMVQARRVCAGHDPGIDNSISCSNWFRSSGNTGWYNTTYKGGWYMSDTSWIRAHNSVGIYTGGQIYSGSSIRMGNILLEHADEINNITNGSINLNYRNSGNISLCQGGGNVGIGTMSPTYKLDVNGQMRTSGFHHSSMDSNNYILLAGGGYKSFGGDLSNYIFLGCLNLRHGDDGTISSSFKCLGYSVPFTYTRGGSYCEIHIPDTTHQEFYIAAAIASVNYSGEVADTQPGYHRGAGAWWLHCYVASSNEVRVKGFHQANKNNDSWWGGNPLWSSNDGAHVITVCIFGFVLLR